MAFKSLSLAVLAVLAFAFTAAAEARPRHHQGKHHHARTVQHALHPPAAYRDRHHRTRARHLRAVRSAPAAHAFSLFGGVSSLVAAARSQIGNGAIYGRATLWCARFVNEMLHATGRPGTGSDAAASFARYGTRVDGPRVGAIAVMSRRGGGHVGIVSGVDRSGNPIVVSGNHNRRVAETVYPRTRVYAYVVPN